MLMHFSAYCILWIDLNALKEFEFDMILFHTIKNYKPDNKWPSHKAIQPIIFLLCLFTIVE